MWRAEHSGQHPAQINTKHVGCCSLDCWNLLCCLGKGLRYLPPCSNRSSVWAGFFRERSRVKERCMQWSSWDPSSAQWHQGKMPIVTSLLQGSLRNLFLPTKPLTHLFPAEWAWKCLGKLYFCLCHLDGWKIIKNYALACCSSWQLDTGALSKLLLFSRAVKRGGMLKYQYRLINENFPQKSGKYASTTVLPSSLWVPISSHMCSLPNCHSMQHPLNFHPAAKIQNLEAWGGCA